MELYYDTRPHFFHGTDGNYLLADKPDYEGRFYDWCVTLNTIYSHTPTPRTIYIKTDFLPRFTRHILPTLKNPFILITVSSDMSPEQNAFNLPLEQCYKEIIENPLLIHWFMTNMKTPHPKVSAYPQGLGSHQMGNVSDKNLVEFIIFNSIKNIPEKIDKVFVSFRENGDNIAGEEMTIRPKILQIVKEHPEIFDYYEPTMGFEEFCSTLSKYKYSLCIHGNGIDPNPTAWVSLALHTIPVMYNTVNAKSIFEDVKDSVIFFDNFEDILNKDIYIDRKYCDINFLSNRYWINKIKNYGKDN